MLRITEEKRELIQAAKKNCEDFLYCLDQILEGNSTIGNACTYLGKTSCYFYRNLKRKDLPRIIAGIKKEDFFEMVKKNQPSFYRLLDDLLGTSDCLISVPETQQELFLKKIKKKLTKRKWEYVRLYYGLEGTQPLTNRELAKHFKVSKQAVSSALNHALEIMKDPSNMILLFPEYQEYVQTLHQAAQYKKERQQLEELKKKKETAGLSSESKELINMLLKGISIEQAKNYLDQSCDTLKGTASIHFLKNVPELQSRTYNVLMRNGINTLEKLCQYSLKDLGKLKGIGPTTMNDVMYVLRLYGKTLRTSHTSRDVLP